MGKTEDTLKLNKFLKEVENDSELLKEFINFIDIDDETRKSIKVGLKIIRKRIKEIKKAESIKDVKKHVKMKRLDKMYEIRGDVAYDPNDKY